MVVSTSHPTRWRWGWPDPDDDPNTADADQLHVEDTGRTVPPTLGIADMGATPETRALIAAAPEMEALLRDVAALELDDLDGDAEQMRDAFTTIELVREFLNVRIDPSRKA